MPKKVSENQKQEMVDSFKNGKTIDELSEKYKCTKITIKKHLKKVIDEKDFKNLIYKNNQKKELRIEPIQKDETNSRLIENSLDDLKLDESEYIDSSFIEIAPLDYEIENSPRKELSSIPLSEVEFPKNVYMVVDKNIELNIKLLKDFPEWDFLPKVDLNRKTLEIYFDLHSAKRSCQKDQKVIKVPNTDVFRIVAPILIARGISRIVSSEQLIAL